MTCNANGRQLLDKFSFIIQCEALKADAGFATMSELKSSTEVVEYRAGGSLISSKSPGLASFDPVTFTRGATRNVHALEDWYTRVTDGSVRRAPQQGGAMGGITGVAWPGDYCCPVMVHQTSRAHMIVQSWRLVNAWPSEFSALDGLDNNSSERIIESMTLELDYFIRVDRKSGGLLSALLRGGLNAGVDLGQTAIVDAANSLSGLLGSILPNP